ncbi:MAG: class I SAM-dependent methyltransferase [Chitinophagaceae bacterium]
MSTKEIQGRLWSTAPHNWAMYFEPFFLPLYQKALEHVSLMGNISLLDAGCGSGLFSHMAIRTGANVIGIDAAPGLLNIARERNPRNNFLEEDMEALPFANEYFNYVVGFNAFQFAGNTHHALTEAKRVLKKGGRLVVGIWDKPECSDAYNVLKEIVSLMPPPSPDTPGPFSLSEDGRMIKLFESLELKPIYQTRVSCPFLYHSLSDGIKSFMGIGPAAAAMNYASRKHVEQTIAGALQPYHLTEDLYHLQNSFLLFIAEK